MINFRKHKTVLGKILILCLFFFNLFIPFSAFSAEVARPTLVGEIAYAEPMKFDHTQDGKPNDIQLWVAIDIKPAHGEKGDPGCRKKGICAAI